MRRIGKWAHIPAHLCEEHFNRVSADPGNRIEALDGFFEWAQPFLDLPVQTGNRPLLRVDHLQEFTQHKALVFVHPTAQRLGQRIALGRHIRQPQISQFLGIRFSLGQRMENTSSRLAQNVGEHRTSLEVGFLQQFVQAIDQARVLLAQRQAVAADLFVLLSICVVLEEAGHHKTFVDVHSTTGLIQDLHTSHPPSLISQSIMGERSPTGCLPMGWDLSISKYIPFHSWWCLGEACLFLRHLPPISADPRSRACCPHSRSSWAICSCACCGRSTSGGL